MALQDLLCVPPRCCGYYGALEKERLFWTSLLAPLALAHNRSFSSTTPYHLDALDQVYGEICTVQTKGDPNIRLNLHGFRFRETQMYPSCAIPQHVGAPTLFSEEPQKLT